GRGGCLALPLSPFPQEVLDQLVSPGSASQPGHLLSRASQSGTGAAQHDSSVPCNAGTRAICDDLHFSHAPSCGEWSAHGRSLDMSVALGRTTSLSKSP